MGLVQKAGARRSVIGAVCLAASLPTFASVVLMLLVGCNGSASAQPVTANPGDPFAALRTVPLRLPAVAAGQPCPKTEPQDLGANLGAVSGAALGQGPVYLVSGSNAQGATWGIQAGHPSKVAWGSAPTYEGPITIRGDRIDGAR